MRRNLAALSVALALAALAVALRAGPLDPPAGPVVPTYKTLNEVEPRIPVNAVNTPGDAANLFIISQPGSYILTSGVTAAPGFTGNGIRVTASHVSIDLRGLSITGVVGSANGIIIVGVGLSDVSVENGEVRAWGQSGINGASNGVKRVALRRLNVTGCGFYGAFLGGESVVEDCFISQNAPGGLVVTGVVTGCVAVANTGPGYSLSSSSTALNCSAQGNTNGGFSLGTGCTLTGCTSQGNGGIGIQCNFGCAVVNCASSGGTGAGGDGFSTADDCTLTGCSASMCARDGIVVASRCTVTRCTAGGNARNQFTGIDSNVFLDNNAAGVGSSPTTGAGFIVTGFRNRVEGNTATGQTSGYSAANLQNIFVRNAASGNTNNYGNINAGNLIGTVVNTSATLNGAANSLVNITY